MQRTRTLAKVDCLRTVLFIHTKEAALLRTIDVVCVLIRSSSIIRSYVMPGGDGCWWQLRMHPSLLRLFSRLGLA